MKKSLLVIFTTTAAPSCYLFLELLKFLVEYRLDLIRLELHFLTQRHQNFLGLNHLLLHLGDLTSQLIIQLFILLLDRLYLSLPGVVQYRLVITSHKGAEQVVGVPLLTSFHLLHDGVYFEYSFSLFG